jgi:hypothetical protein
MQQVQAGFGLWDILFFIFTGSGLLGLPPGDRDPGLLKSVPPQTLVYFEWASRGKGLAGAAGIDGFAADPEIRQFFELLDAALVPNPGEPKPEGGEVADVASGPRSELPQIAKILSARPGCLFVGFEPPAPNKPGIAGWINVLVGVHGGLIFSSGDQTEALWQHLNHSLQSIPGFQFDPASTTQSIPLRLPGYKLVLHRQDQRIVVALGEGTLERVIEGLSGRVPGLDSNPAFRQAQDRVAVPRVGTVGWVDGKGLVGSVTAALGPLGGLVRPMLTLVGIDAMDHVAFASGVDNETMVHRTFIATGGRTDGIMVLAGGTPIQPRQFSHIPADADLVLATSISLVRVFRESRQLLARVQPLSVRVFDEAVKQLESELGLKIVEDILPAFGDVVAAFDSPSAGGMIASSLVVSLEVRDPAKAAQVFDRLMKFVDQTLSGEHTDQGYDGSVSLRQQAFLGQTIFYVNTISNGYGNQSPFTPSFCLTDRHLLFSVHPQAMKAQLRHLQSRAPGFDQQATRKISLPPGETLSYAYLNGPRASAIAGGLLPYLGQSWLSRLEAEGLPMDPFAVPSAAAIAPYFGDSTGVVTRQKDGLMIEARNAPPVLATVALLSAYRQWQASEHQSMDEVRQRNANGGDQLQLGAAENEVVPAVAEKHAPPAPAPKANPAPNRTLAPLLLKALIPGDVQLMIPESTLRQLEEGPSAATLQRREDARRKREERRRRRLEPLPPQ